MNEIIKALEIMGAEIWPGSDSKSYALKRVQGSITISRFMPEVQVGVFIRECTLFLREKGYRNFEIFNYDQGAKIAGAPLLDSLRCDCNNARAVIQVEAESEVLAYAKAVIRAGEEG